MLKFEILIYYYFRDNYYYNWTKAVPRGCFHFRRRRRCPAHCHYQRSHHRVFSSSSSCASSSPQRVRSSSRTRHRSPRSSPRTASASGTRNSTLTSSCPCPHCPLCPRSSPLSCLCVAAGALSSPPAPERGIRTNIIRDMDVQITK